MTKAVFTVKATIKDFADNLNKYRALGNYDLANSYLDMLNGALAVYNQIFAEELTYDAIGDDIVIMTKEELCARYNV